MSKVEILCNDQWFDVNESPDAKELWGFALNKFKESDNKKEKIFANENCLRIEGMKVITLEDLDNII